MNTNVSVISVFEDEKPIEQIMDINAAKTLCVRVAVSTYIDCDKMLKNNSKVR